MCFSSSSSEVSPFLLVDLNALEESLEVAGAESLKIWKIIHLSLKK